MFRREEESEGESVISRLKSDLSRAVVYDLPGEMHIETNRVFVQRVTGTQTV